MELATHACGEVAGSDRLQQARERLQVAIGGGHQGVEAFHHHPEVVLETLGIAAGTEVAIGRRCGQVLDLGIHCRQVEFDLRHGVGEHGLFAGQLVHVLAEIADGVAAHDLRKLQFHRDMRCDQIVGIACHAAVVAWERIGIDAVADLAFIMAPGHVGLRAQQIAQLLLHLAHRLEQAPGLVVELGIDIVIQPAAGDGFCSAGRAAQRLGQAAGDQHAQGAAQQHDQQRTADQQLARLVHGLQRSSGGVARQLVLQCDVFCDLVLPLLHRRCSLGQQQGQGVVAMASHHQLDDLVVQALDDLSAAIDFCTNFLAFFRGRGCVQGLACLDVVCTGILDVFDKLEIVLVGGRQHDIANLRGNDGVGIHHGVGQADFHHVLINQVIHQRTRRAQATIADKGNQPRQHDKNGEGGGQSWADVITLEKVSHGWFLGRVEQREERYADGSDTRLTCRYVL